MSRLPRAARDGRPQFHADPAIDRLVAMVLGLASEVSVLTDRLATVERLAALPPDAIDAYTPGPAEREAREARRDALLDRILAPLTGELEALGESRAAYWERIRRIEAGED
jgi:hypothetical protein